MVISAGGLSEGGRRGGLGQLGVPREAKEISDFGLLGGRPRGSRIRHALNEVVHKERGEGGEEWVD